MNNTFDPYAKLVLDKEEQALESALESADFEELSGLEETRAMLNEAALRYNELHTTKPITLRVNQMDLIKIKAKAKRSNIPYQTLLGAVLHDFAENKTEIKLS